MSQTPLPLAASTGLGARAITLADETVLQRFLSPTRATSIWCMVVRRSRTKPATRSRTACPRAGVLPANGRTVISIASLVSDLLAQGFWRRGGYAQVRTRDDIELGLLRHQVSSMLKSLAPSDLTDDLKLMPHDRNGSMAPSKSGPVLDE
ncbi:MULTISPECIES: hypothetical protein [unclassified Pseudomonas]|uniref:hypothetical protein n=1 Tax=unclassified Pseudomonas TaxID=196821 RepID=UPI0021AD554D|nr:hypothetical protein [Pseudomonas sp. MSSRFD41]